MKCGLVAAFLPGGEESASVSPVLSLKSADKAPPLSAVLTRPGLISIASYEMIALLTKISGSRIPLVWSTSVELGGLGLSPACGYQGMDE